MSENTGEIIAMGLCFVDTPDGRAMTTGAIRLPRPRAEMTDDEAMDAYRSLGDGEHLTRWAHRDVAAIMARRLPDLSL